MLRGLHHLEDYPWDQQGSIIATLMIILRRHIRLDHNEDKAIMIHIRVASKHRVLVRNDVQTRVSLYDESLVCKYTHNFIV